MQNKPHGALKISLPLLAVPLLAAALLIPGCSRKEAGAAQGFSTSAVKGLAYDNYETILGDFSSAEAPAGEPQRARAMPEADQEDDVERKLVKRADISIRVEDMEKADTSLSALMERYGAYAAFTEIGENYLHYSIRVPSISYSAFLDGANSLGKTLRRSESAEDVTLRYFDLEGRLATKRELLKTFQAYLGRARNIEEILSVETRIADLQSEIEGTGKELRNLANRIDFATVDLNISGPVASTPYRGPTLGERTRELFSGFGTFLSTIVVFLTGIVIYGIPILLLVVFFFWLLFGRLGLLKKLWRAVMDKKN